MVRVAGPRFARSVYRHLPAANSSNSNFVGLSACTRTEVRPHENTAAEDGQVTLVNGSLASGFGRTTVDRRRRAGDYFIPSCGFHLQYLRTRRVRVWNGFHFRLRLVSMRLCASSNGEEPTERLRFKKHRTKRHMTENHGQG